MTCATYYDIFTSSLEPSTVTFRLYLLVVYSVLLKIQFRGGGSHGNLHRRWLHHSMYCYFNICMSVWSGYKFKMTRKELDASPTKSTSSSTDRD